MALNRRQFSNGINFGALAMCRVPFHLSRILPEQHTLLIVGHEIAAG